MNCSLSFFLFLVKIIHLHGHCELIQEFMRTRNCDRININRANFLSAFTSLSQWAAKKTSLNCNSLEEWEEKVKRDRTSTAKKLHRWTLNEVDCLFRQNEELQWIQWTSKKPRVRQKLEWFTILNCDSGLRHADGPEEGILIDIKRAHGEERSVDGEDFGCHVNLIPTGPSWGNCSDCTTFRYTTWSFSLRLEVSHLHFCPRILICFCLLLFWRWIYGAV